MIEQLLDEIPLLKDYRELKRMNKGFSSDEKYCISLKNNDKKYMIRVFPIGQFEVKEKEFALLKTIETYTTKTIKAIEIGKMQGHGYMVTTYMDGNDVEDELLVLTEEEQYQLGFEAGQELLNLHKLQAPKHIESWYERKSIKHRHYVKTYLACPIKIDRDEKILQFIDNHMSLMENRPNLFQHDDYHPSNLIAQKGKFKGIIDFGRYDWGDPIHEFVKIGIFTRNISVPFSIGQIKGYFNGEEPSNEFWTLYSLYLAMCVFSTVVWTLKTIPEDMDNMVNRIHIFLEDHQYFTNVKPCWYK
ncbi:aminoglycoside phosphotransferase family protein [Lysinibacillus sp. NPDC097214]|uniref:aminoglycoside phosphotransferase family protein n=1 Tax=Lysinibacillus sp. NPDC097214 TaxID=3390584 RepID=UPI003D07DB3D